MLVLHISPNDVISLDEGQFLVNKKYTIREINAANVITYSGVICKDRLNSFNLGKKYSEVYGNEN